MRSHLVHIAKAQIPNRFELIHVTAKAVRLFHKPAKQTIGRTINEAFERIAATETKEIRQPPDMGLEPQVLVAEM